MTNYEKIKNMSIKEFAKFIDDIRSNCHLNGRYKTKVFCKILSNRMRRRRISY